MKSLFGTLVCLTLSASTIAAPPTTAEPPTTTACPSDGTTVEPYPGDCTKFISCIDGVQSVEDCPDGFFFNDVIGACDFPENVPECAEEPTTQTPITCDAGSADGFEPYPGDCSKYIKCDGIRGSVMDCPAGLYWNQAKSQCDFPENTDCDDSTSEAPTTEVPTTEAPTTEVPTTEAPTTEVPTTENPTTEQPTTEVPTTDTEVPTTENPTTPPTTPSGITCTDGANYMPYPGDCTKYVKCDGDRGTVMQCPDGLNWNQAAEECDFPENTNCDIPSTSENPSTETTVEPTTEEQ